MENHAEKLGIAKIKLEAVLRYAEDALIQINSILETVSTGESERESSALFESAKHQNPSGNFPEGYVEE